MKKILVANRSEIAVRIFRSATELGLRTVAIYSHDDRFGVHRFKADEAYLVGEGKGPVAAYLDIESIIKVAKEANVDAIHPGYGFLSENPTFARACRDAGIVFIGPDAELIDKMGDKVAARAAAEAANVPTLPGTQDAISNPRQAARLAKKIGFPLIIKAAFGGGGRGMRVVKKEKDLMPLLEEAQNEAHIAFGNNAVFLERYIERAKHIEVQVLGDRHGNVVHLFERDCSVQRRHQKVVEIAPSIGLDPEMRQALCDAAVRLATEIGYQNAGTVEYLYDCDTDDWFFIEMNPRIQVEHTVTEIVTSVDIVRSQILVSQGKKIHGPEIHIPQQDQIQCHGYAIQSRITTEDPANGFTPDYGRIVSYRSAAGFGVRLDGAMGDTGAIITPFFDSLLVKVTAFASTFENAIARMDRALREFRIRGVKTNIPFIENVILHEQFKSGKATTTMIDTSPELFEFKPRKDRASKLLNYLGDTIVNGNDQVKGRSVPGMQLPLLRPSYDPNKPKPQGTRDQLLKLGADGFSQWLLKQKRLMVTDTTFRDAHQSLFAARMRTVDMLNCADSVSQNLSNLFSLEMWGGATYDTSMRFLKECPYERLRAFREKTPNILFQMLLRGANAVGYSNYPDNVVSSFVKHAAEAGMDLFRVFDSLNYLPNLKVAMQAVRKTHALCEGTICYTGDIDDPKRDKYSLKYYVDLAKELEKMGAHVLAIKDMAGLCKPFAIPKLVKALKQEIGIPIHFHTHDSSGIASASVIKAAEAGVDVVDLAISSMSGLTSQPNLNSIVAALDGHPRDTQLDQRALNELSLYWEAVRQYYEPFDTGPKFGSAEVYEHEMPGGQYTNLREQAFSLGLGRRWPEVVHAYEEVNQLLGDIVKVTPSSKCVGDLAIFLVTRGIKVSDVVNLEPGSSFPASIVDMLSGGLGQPKGGWPKAVQRVVLGDVKPRAGRPGSYAKKIDLKEEQTVLSKKLGRPATEDDLFRHLMYPDVFAQFCDFEKSYGDVSVLPTPAYFYGLKPNEEIEVEIEKGKVLYIKLINVGDANDEGYRHITFELNGRARDISVLDKSIQSTAKPKEKAAAGDDKQVGAPIPGMVCSISTNVGAKVKPGDKLLTIEAMKMQTTVYAQTSGIVDRITVEVGDSIDAKDLLVSLR
ncbi:pyruvate carboxylase [Pelagicoccus sp. SDUM812002]|uniref:pyruvate carboxylase n=1 Tax=Pelagicoccus sp. SDUM812002 TaxID=3041266 RepID=UPI00280FF56C|nr:pyruvate carboxylase [Pelagicoccus sp. SDUM812002]MDQ8188224.1 pyruvate carboxylase [Pelagicoccus sp. SDUM812002]